MDYNRNAVEMADCTNGVNFFRTSCGDGVAVTSLPVTNDYSAIANGGTLMHPWIAAPTSSPDDITVEPDQPEFARLVVIDDPRTEDAKR